MTEVRLGRRALSVAAAAMLVACSTSPSTIGSTGGTPEAQLRPASGSGNCPALPGGTGILPDGDFSRAPNPGDITELNYKGQVFAPDWEVSERTVNFTGTTYWDMGGYCSVDLDGNNAGGIRTSAFQTRAGARYRVTFLLSGNGCEDTIPYGPKCPEEKECKLVAANQFQSFTWDVYGDNDAEHGDYKGKSWKFIAAQRLTVLTFSSEDTYASARGCVVAAFNITKS